MSSNALHTGHVRPVVAACDRWWREQRRATFAKLSRRADVLTDRTLRQVGMAGGFRCWQTCSSLASVLYRKSLTSRSGMCYGSPVLGRTELVGPVPDADFMPDQLRAAIVLFASLLHERQRRLYAGLESLKCGWGGDARIAGLLGIDPGTVARGRKQLLAQDIERERVRRPGGGRPPLEKKLPR